MQFDKSLQWLYSVFTVFLKKLFIFFSMFVSQASGEGQLKKWRNGEIEKLRKWESDTKSEWSKEKGNRQRRKNVKVLGGERNSSRELPLKYQHKFIRNQVSKLLIANIWMAYQKLWVIVADNQQEGSWTIASFAIGLIILGNRMLYTRWNGTKILTGAKDKKNKK